MIYLRNFGLFLLGIVLLAGVVIGGRELNWWLRKDNVDRQVRIDNRNTGTQTAWADEAKNMIIDIELLPDGTPAKANLVRQTCDLIGRLTSPYQTDDLVSFQTQECM